MFIAGDRIGVNWITVGSTAPLRPQQPLRSLPVLQSYRTRSYLSWPTTRPPPPPTAEDPGKTLGIVGLVLAILAPVIGIIVSAIARSQSQKAGFQNQFAKIGLIVGIVLTVLLG